MTPSAVSRPSSDSVVGRFVGAMHGLRSVQPDADHEAGLTAALVAEYGRAELEQVYRRFSAGDAYLDHLLRRAALRALAGRFGQGVTIAPHVAFRHPETFDIGDGVFIGEQAILQGRHDGRCVIGACSWIGPQAFLDARDLVLGERVGWGPGARVLGSAHTGQPIDRPIIATDLEIAPVRVGDWADVGVNAVILPGVTLGRGCIVGAGAVVTKDVPDFAKVAGVPARIIGWRDSSEERAAR
jgi:acetyltransferase-like isoleucine patch superfamily enzyme